MNNHKSTLPFSYSLTDSLCLLLLHLRHLSTSKVLFLRLFGGLERHRKLVQPDTVERCWTIAREGLTFQVWHFITSQIFTQDQFSFPGYSSF